MSFLFHFILLLARIRSIGLFLIREIFLTKRNGILASKFLRYITSKVVFVFRYHAMKTHGEMEVQLHILNLGTRWR